MLFVSVHYFVEFTWVVTHGEDHVSYGFLNILSRLQNAIDELELGCISSMDGHTCQGQERAELIW